MWFLTHLSTGSIIYITKAKTTIGRLGTDIELAGDDSISRNHAVLTVTSNGLTIKDAGSKYGTFIIDGEQTRKVEAQPVKVVNETQLKFGKLQNHWTVHKTAFKTMTSMLVQGQKEKLGRVLNALDVEVADSFDETCTHLTMPQNTEVSHKLLQALSSCTPIVTLKFWMAFQESVTKNQPLPKCLDFTPKIKEEAFITPDTVSLISNPERRRLFARKSFVFISKTQLNNFEGIITSAGGKAGVPKQLGMTSKDVVAKNVIVIQPRESATQSQNEDVLNKIRTKLAAENRRMISDTEIGLAMLHCSIERWCNPEFKTASIFEPTQSENLKITKSKVLAIGTEHSESVNIETPTTSKRAPRNKPAVVDIADLESEEAGASNKENVPNHTATEDISLPVTQTDDPMPSTLTESINIPATIQTDLSSIPDQDESSTDSSRFPPRRTTRRSPMISESTFQSAVSRVDSQSSTASSLFNFTEASAFSKRSQRKRKNTENENDKIQPSTSAAPPKQVQEQPVTKKSKRNQVQDDSDEEPLPQPRSSRKRPANDSEGGLFAFNTKFAKKSKPTEVEKESQGVVGIVPLSKPRGPSPAVSRKSTDGCLSDLGDGVWLSKKMLLLDVTDGIKSEILITPIKIERIKKEATMDSQDIKPSQLDTLFSVLESTLTTTTSLVSKRKQFVKKLNFKPQDRVVTTKSVKVEDTFMPLDDF